MAKMSAEQLAQRALDLNLVTEAQLRQLWAESGSRNISSDQIQQLLLRRELLTNYQIERLLAGQRTGFFYGDYKVLYLVGTGTFARVFRAAHHRTNELVAVKVLRRRFSDDAEQADRFYREGKLCAALQHPNIVPIFQVHSQAGTHYLVMEFVEGRNLREFVRVRKRLEPVEATKLMLGVANGLDHAFQHGISHRDIKMSNVLVSSRGQAKLVDFGLAGADANLSDEALAKLANPRTIDYAGLERTTGVRKDDARSDIFFVACMYYHMLTGHAALVETKDRIQRLSKARFQEIRPILDVCPTVPLSAAKVVNKAIEFNPDRRYQTPGDLAADLKQVLNRLENTDSAPKVKLNAEGRSALSEGRKEDGRARTIMIVESDAGLQDVFRDQLKRRGYRVLVTSDPDRARSRFAQDPNVADLVLFSTCGLGESALAAYNEAGRLPSMREIPAVLLLDEQHGAWAARVQTASHRVVLNMPIKVRQLREVLVRLFATEVA
jgi:serine/threonine-protein kinase